MALSPNVLAAVAALGVALFPCACATHRPGAPWVHAVSALVMFLILACFCAIFYRRARAKGYVEARQRARIYAASGALIVLAIWVLGLNWMLGGIFVRAVPRLVFYGEAAALTAFGISWLTASHVLPGINRPSERFAPWRMDDPR